MLIDWVKSYIILIYTYEVTAFSGLEIFVKHRILYDSLHLSVGPAKFSQLKKWQFSQELEGYTEK